MNTTTRTQNAQSQVKPKLQSQLQIPITKKEDSKIQNYSNYCSKPKYQDHLQPKVEGMNDDSFDSQSSQNYQLSLDANYVSTQNHSQPKLNKINPVNYFSNAISNMLEEEEESENDEEMDSPYRDKYEILAEDLDPNQDLKEQLSIDDVIQQEIENLDHNMGLNFRLQTETAYYSEQRPGPNLPIASSFVHSIIQSNHGSIINPQRTAIPVFSRYYEDRKDREDIGAINEEEDNDCDIRYLPLETAEVVQETERGPRIVHQSDFECRHSRQVSSVINVEEIIEEELKFQEFKEQIDLKQSTRSANIVDDDDEEEVGEPIENESSLQNSNQGGTPNNGGATNSSSASRSEQRKIKNFAKEFKTQQLKQQRFSIKARQIMEEIYGNTYQNNANKQLNDDPTFQQARDLIEIRLFQKSIYYKAMEQATLIGDDMIVRDNSSGKFDLDSEHGQLICKNYLQCIERFFTILKLKTSSRDYRLKFTKAYKVLYSENQLCYLTEILDSAQEGFPFLWVNGEKYVFSNDVLDSGQALFQHFCKVRNFLSGFAKKLQRDEITELVVLDENKEKLQSMLEQLDQKWTHYEQAYVFELMVIETDARRYIVEVIDLEKKLVEFEKKEKKKGNYFIQNDEEYNDLRSQFIKKICLINSVANNLGKGRDDFLIDILLKAEEISIKVSAAQSKAVRKLADSIKSSLHTIRILFRKYEENIEVVDPQLKNNAELVEVLNEFEKVWAIGKEYILDAKKCQQLISFSQIIEYLSEKHTSFGDQIEYREADIFITIPCLLVFKTLEDDGLDSNVCKRFFPLMFREDTEPFKKFNTLKDEYQKVKVFFIGSNNGGGSTKDIIRTSNLKKKSPGQSPSQMISHLRKNSFDFHNELERIILFGIESQQVNHQNYSSCDAGFGELINQNNSNERYLVIYSLIKQLGMELQRYNPTEWNEFMTACLGLN